MLSVLLCAGATGARGFPRSHTPRGRGAPRPPQPGDISPGRSAIARQRLDAVRQPPLAVPPPAPAAVSTQLHWLHPAPPQAGLHAPPKKGAGRRTNPAGKANTQRDESRVTRHSVAAPKPRACSGLEDPRSLEHRAWQWQQGGIQALGPALASLACLLLPCLIVRAQGAGQDG